MNKLFTFLVHENEKKEFCSLLRFADMLFSR